MAGADRELSILPVLSLCNRSTVELSHIQVINQDGIFQVAGTTVEISSTKVIYLALLERITPSYLVWNHFMASSLVRRWGKPTLPT